MNESKMNTVHSKDGTQIAFIISGSGSPLVLVHGGGANDHTRWELAGVRAAFAEHFKVYAMDCRGRGESGDNKQYKLEREFEDVAAVVDSIEEPVILLGHSLGALFSLEAARRTTNIHKIILYEPPVLMDQEKLTYPGKITELKRLLDKGENEQALILFMKDVAKTPPGEIEKLRSAPNWPGRVEAAHTVLREVQGVNEYQFDTEKFTDMDTPTLLLSGSESPPLFQYATKLLNKTLPNSRVSVFDGHGHVAMLTATDTFIEEVLEFIRDPNYELDKEMNIKFRTQQ